MTRALLIAATGVMLSVQLGAPPVEAGGAWVLWKKWEWYGVDDSRAGRGSQTTWEILYTSDTRAECEVTSEARSRVMEESHRASGMSKIVFSSGAGHYVVEIRDKQGELLGIGTSEHYCLPDTIDPRGVKK